MFLSVVVITGAATLNAANIRPLQGLIGHPLNPLKSTV
ncbi:Uncharacterized protein dnm_065260 [Desulfonema magnum]|uniref:Uncharacterized protein n=1 Tax=Desulfonema magnum TaxID=45655 RepID=A0A975GR15_9BACT|nr:Uncharacterized protein dnm_065260 [Desulfonema magnum]